MNKENRAKLRMENPEYYDATDGSALVVQRIALGNLLSKAKNDGLRVGGWLGSLTLGLQSLASLSTTTEFKPFLGMTGPSWGAFFFMVLIADIVVFATLSVSLAPDFLRKLFRKSVSGVDHLFSADRKIK